ncbi:MAG TPA: hypothetical protein VGN64_11850, partial [Dyadobacter sp.]|nr:hypothetical protein [Dyadobacter sp.]
MKRTFIKKGFFACIITLLTAVSSIAQTTTATTVTPNPVCVGSTITVAFSTTGSFIAGNVFKVELSKDDGTFPGTPLTTTGTASPLTATILGTTTAGTAYKVRVTASDPATTTTTASAAFAINAIPAAPTFTAPPSYVTGATASALVATGVTGSTLNWYDSADSPLAGAPVPTTTAAGTQTYKVSQTVGGCESAKATITVTVSACTPPALPTTTAAVTYTVGDVATALTATGLTGSTIKWYSASDSPLSAAPVPTTTTAGT